MRWKDESIGGFKIKIDTKENKSSKQEILEKVAAQLTTLEEKYGIEEFGCISIYLQMYVNNARMILATKSELGDDIREYHSGVSIEANGNHKLIVENPDGSTTITINKGINVDLIEEKVKKSRAKAIIQVNNIAHEALTITQFKKRVSALENPSYKERIDFFREQNEIRVEKYKNTSEEDKRHEAVINEIKDMVVQEFNLEGYNQLSYFTTSIARVQMPHAILKYLKESEIPEDGFVYRAGIRGKETKKLATVRIFNSKCELIKEIHK